MFQLNICNWLLVFVFSVLVFIDINLFSMNVGVTWIVFINQVIYCEWYEGMMNMFSAVYIIVWEPGSQSRQMGGFWQILLCFQALPLLMFLFLPKLMSCWNLKLIYQFESIKGMAFVALANHAHLSVCFCIAGLPMFWVMALCCIIFI